MLLVTNRCRAPKNLVFRPIRQKPDSGLWADDAQSKCIRPTFPSSLYQTRGKRDRLIAGYVSAVSTLRNASEKLTKNIAYYPGEIKHLFYPGRYAREFLVGLCRPVLQVLTLFQAKKLYFPHLLSHLAS